MSRAKMNLEVNQGWRMAWKQLVALPVFALLGASVFWAQVPAVLGVWDLDLGSSDLPAQVFPAGIQSETRSYAMRSDGYLVVLALRVNGNRTLDFIQVAAKSDGKDYPQYQTVPLADLQISGKPTPLTYSEKLTGDNTAEVIAKREGQVINKGTRAISADGKTMRVNVAVAMPDGKEVPIVLVFRKRT